MDSVKDQKILSQTDIDTLVKAIDDGRLEEWLRSHKEYESKKSRFKDDVIYEAEDHDLFYANYDLEKLTDDKSVLRRYAYRDTQSFRRYKYFMILEDYQHRGVNMVSAVGVPENKANVSYDYELNRNHAVVYLADASSFTYFRPAKNKEVNNISGGIVIMTELLLHLNCSFTQSEKQECVRFIKRIKSLANLARTYGILALEEEMESEESFFLKTGISLIVDGTDPVLVKTILQNLILSDKYTGAELLGRLILAEGVLSIQQGENPRIIGLKLASMLGEEFVRREKEEFLCEQMDVMKKIQFLEEVKGKQRLPESSVFESKILDLDNRSIQLVLRGISEACLIGALCGCGGEVVRKIFSNVSEALGYRLEQGMEVFKLEDKEYVLKCQAKILEKAASHERMGEIVTINRRDGVVTEQNIVTG